MSHQVAWTKLIVEEFIEQACLSKDEEFVLRTRKRQTNFYLGFIVIQI